MHYKGGFSRCWPDGQGVLTRPDGKHYEDEFRPGDFQGVSTQSAGACHEGAWDVKPSSVASAAHSDDVRYEGTLNVAPSSVAPLAYSDEASHGGTLNVAPSIIAWAPVVMPGVIWMGRFLASAIVSGLVWDVVKDAFDQTGD